jgi:hypothetical protein
MTFSKKYYQIKGKKAETFVHNLASKTFLTDWCYLNPKLPNGKELCDLLVVFDDIAIIWQIKSLKLDSSGKYKEAETQKNIRQLIGARRQLFELKTPIELVNPKRGKEKLDTNLIKHVFLVSVLFGRKETLSVFAEQVKNQVIHVFPRDFTQIILNELDTISDFTGYLKEKEALLEKDQQITILGGEEELLAFYIGHNRSLDALLDATSVIIEEGSWQKLVISPQYLAKKKENEISYAWDGIINAIHDSSSEYEKVARELARPNRFERRVLGKCYLEAYTIADSEKIHPLFDRVFSYGDVTYCFLFADEPRDHRKIRLSNICYIARGKFIENKKVIGIATEKYANPSCSYDLIFLKIPTFTEEDHKEMKLVQQKTGILLKPNMSMFHEDEYPVPFK